MFPRSGSSPNLLFSRIGLPSYLNLSRRLLRWMKLIRLPRTHLRMRYVRLVHAYHVLDGSCSHISLIDAMATLLVGWIAVDVAGVRVAVVTFGHDSVIYFGRGASTIYLYKVFML
jgi:hypothetical protein